MNRYASETWRAWQIACPSHVQQMNNPEEFFENLGQQASMMISELTPQLAGPDEPGETYFHKVGRLNRARMQAEEIVRAEILAPPEIEDDEELNDPSRPDSDPMWGQAGSPESLRSWAERMDQIDRDNAEIDAQYPEETDKMSH
ncbi:hypothetical protein FYJ43_00005 [Cutibacterium sp. WCA-380-WT-3A]|uniref:TnpV protein n=1 Tax=Cutibacterium porci TaxID=2605781 RepID=A0A7K0J3H4_9ACTN|nr:hypothetical protein [Cutibacterium porci]MSS44476.1 hypothetical protein [Cutibacterium porci]